MVKRFVHLRQWILAAALLIGAVPGCSEQTQQKTPSGESTMALEENAKKEGVTVTASGLQYEVLQEGDGPKPTASDTVRVHYAGTLVDGSEFDSSYKRGEPISFPLNGVIKGWTEGVQLMSVGSKYRFTIPGDLAYGARGVPQAGIGPNATLIFEVELLAIQ
ncbi:MAG: FKBP-type peptidyl-prolyl cis-trans isomerase [Magnetococcales bacterium]|nr:FKBP-type peptidyl-prolyl cis-trans isomerase [Magnetococcales bacterium]